VTITVDQNLGVFARTFPRSSADAVAEAVARAGFDVVQLNLNSFGLPTIPGEQALDEMDLPAIRTAFSSRGIAIWGVSLTYNVTHPDADIRARSTKDACRFLARIPELGAAFGTICTGTRDPGNMWRRHPDNTDVSAWRDLHATLEQLLSVATAAGVRLGIEPEAANVISDASRAARLLRELGDATGSVGIVLDPANLLDVKTAPRQRAILVEAFEALANDIVCIHAKDVVEAGYCAAGVGLLDYELIFELRSELPRVVPVVAQDLSEDDSGRVRELLHDQLGRYPWAGVRE
jgi:sugar phosphate isomerase/epimerase